MMRRYTNPRFPYFTLPYLDMIVISTRVPLLIILASIAMFDMLMLRH